MVLLSVAALLAALQLGAKWFPPSYQVLPLLGGALLLGRRAFLRLCAVVALVVASYFLLMPASDYTAPGVVLVVAATALVAYELARSSDETGLGGCAATRCCSSCGSGWCSRGSCPSFQPVGMSTRSSNRPAVVRLPATSWSAR